MDNMNQIQKQTNPRWKRTIVILRLLVAAGAATPAANAGGYTFTKIAALGGAAPGGYHYTFDFERGQLNDHGEAIYTADLTSDGVNDIGEGVFLRSPVGNNITALVLPDSALPGGVTALGYTWGTSSLNEAGDAAFIEGLVEPPAVSPFPAAFGVFRYSVEDNSLRALLLPGATPVPGGGGVFLGATLRISLNNRGTAALAGIFNTPNGLGGGVGVGIFRASRSGTLSKVMEPGDAAPGGKTFDFGENPWINDAGDIAFGGHLAGDEYINTAGGNVGAGETGIYLSESSSGMIRSIVHQGDPAPGGGNFRATWGPILNNAGKILFVGDLTPAPTAAFQEQGIFLYDKGKVVSIARPGDIMPGGGKLANADAYILSHHLNNQGQASFAAVLDSGAEGIYVASGGSLHLVARTGMALPGVGIIANIDSFGYGTDSGNSVINDRGQVLFFANLTDGSGALVLATPNRPEG